jgi:hypothetical protein
MAFSQEEISTCRLIVGPHYVYVVYDIYGSHNALTGVGSGVVSARWLPNQEIEVESANGEIRHYTGHHNWYTTRPGSIRY